MRFINYLNESNPDEIFETIFSDCKEFFKKFKGKNILLYSGRKSETRDHFIKKIRKDRKPRDTPEILHNLLDDGFEKKFGVRPRSGSIMVYSNAEDTRTYGQTYVIFPKGKFNVLWSPQIRDLTSYLGSYYANDLGVGDKPNWFVEIDGRKVEFDSLEKIKSLDKNIYDTLIDGYKKKIKEIVNTYTTKPPVAYNISEIMVLGNEYHAVNYNWVENNYYWLYINEMFKKA